VESVTKFDGYRPNYCHLTPKVDRNGFCPARFLCHGNGLLLPISLAQDNREMYPYTHSGKLSKNEMSGSVRQ
jgi:hypothetical protein